MLHELHETLPYTKVYRISLLKNRFLRSLTPQSVFEHVCFCSKSNCPGKYKGKCQLCCPVNFFDSEYHYFESFGVGLSQLDCRFVKNLYTNLVFLVKYLTNSFIDLILTIYKRLLAIMTY